MMIDIIIRASLIAFVIATCYSLKKIFSEINKLRKKTNELGGLILEFILTDFLSQMTDERKTMVESMINGKEKEVKECNK